MKDKIIGAIAMFVTACLFGGLGYWIGVGVALVTNGLLWIVGSTYSLDLLESGYIVFALGTIVSLLALTKK